MSVAIYTLYPSRLALPSSRENMPDRVHLPNSRLISPLEYYLPQRLSKTTNSNDAEKSVVDREANSSIVLRAATSAA